MASTGALFYFTIRAISGVVTASSIRPGSDLSGQRPSMPPQRQPFGYVNGDRTKPVYLDPSWERFLRFQHEIKLGGDTGFTLPDVAASVEESQSTAQSSAVAVAAYSQQAATNAEALAATVQVLQNNAIPGATQIPPVDTSALSAIP